MTSVYESLLSEYPDKGVVGKPEIRDSENVIADKLRILYNHFVTAKKSKKPILVLIGAGVSTGSKLPDFRGKNGVWTLQAQGKQAEGVDFQKAVPGVSHQAILALHKAGYIRTTITQNVDGLDRKVGIPVKDLIEIHGNLFLEVCETCKREYIRDDIVMSVGFQHTGRNCDGNPRTGRKCRGRLKDATLDWDSAISPSHLTRIRKAWKESSHLLCLGTSLEIIPMGSLPVDAKDRGIQTTTVNFQETAHEKIVNNAIHADVKLVLYSLCVALKLVLDLDDVPDDVPMAMKFLMDEEEEDSEDVKDPEVLIPSQCGDVNNSGTMEVEDVKDPEAFSEDVKPLEVPKIEDVNDSKPIGAKDVKHSEDVKPPEAFSENVEDSEAFSEDVKDPEPIETEEFKPSEAPKIEDVRHSEDIKQDSQKSGDNALTIN